MIKSSGALERLVGTRVLLMEGPRLAGMLASRDLIGAVSGDQRAVP